MVYLTQYPTWLSESHKLLLARPETTRICTKYRFPAPGKATLILKTYDPVSGTCLQYKTDKSAEIGRLITALGGLGKRSMGLEVEEDVFALPSTDEGKDMGKDIGTAAPAKTAGGEADASHATSKDGKPEAGKSDQKTPASSQPPASGGQQGGKKKKKGKK